MKYLKIVATSFIFLLFVSCLESEKQEVSPKKEKSAEKRSNPFQGHISLVRLIANQENYHGKQITVKGYLDLRFEGNAIYLHEDDFQNTITSNAFWVEFTKKNSLTRKHQILQRSSEITVGIMLGFQEDLT